MKETILIYDGFCVLCNNLTNFLMKVDKKQKIKISSLDSEYVNVLKNSNINFPSNIDSVILFKEGKYYSHMEAVIEIGKTLRGIYFLAYLLKAIPKKWRNDLYDYIAKNRYRWFGKYETCKIPDESYNERVLD